ncbi:hypothetical protein TNCV_3614381 [Trichonephila clavipes]|uniref:Uncharacterized protein n=1 Tax=Trichonephila clavipes TaxID=2585209 RepID=A0A8X6SIC5_TRICX|nr:hypothetical protein TNCV_3614381 [Trichonephila clavipes]
MFAACNFRRMVFRYRFLTVDIQLGRYLWLCSLAFLRDSPLQHPSITVLLRRHIPQICVDCHNPCYNCTPTRLAVLNMDAPARWASTIMPLFTSDIMEFC